ncbi:very short patch repair endonuclease [Corallococcus exiguus]|uniref:very short patch repair endonuclease n=1 Tax=Corallococcus exiguus TaxID=83462 RepID=UPI001471E985|nr:very short patch repair endonuclease [Corallococcus exiguus]NNB93696.1 very short patch repair endonuclease [Corallococcus exiguus]NNC14842.1 very short patch repair endonuclease [Corallococcus exiguus]
MGLSRSEQMARIRGTNTSPEVTLRRALWARGLRYRLHARTPAGRPDVVFSASRVAVFIDGCFWHGCPLHYARPRSREEFWSAKLVENVERDARQAVTLESAGWQVVRLWEHEIITELESAVELVERAVQGGGSPWAAQRRVRQVTEVGTGLERREIVVLSAPSDVIEVIEGPRITAKARVVKKVAVPGTTGNPE